MHLKNCSEWAFIFLLLLYNFDVTINNTHQFNFTFYKNALSLLFLDIPLFDLW